MFYDLQKLCHSKSPSLHQVHEHKIASQTRQDILPSTVMNNNDDETTFVIGLVALILSIVGLITSILALCTAWILPCTKATMPDQSKQAIPQIPRRPKPTAIRKIQRDISHKRSVSSPVLPVQTPVLCPERPRTTRHVSFNLDSTQLSRFKRKVPFRRSSSPNSTSLLLKEQSALPTSARSSLDSNSPGTASTSPLHKELLLPSFDESRECDTDQHLISDPSPISSSRTSPRSSLTLSLRLPSIKKALSGKGRKGSTVSASHVVSSEVEDEMSSSNSQPRDPVLPLPTITVSVSRPGETTRISIPLWFKSGKSKSSSPADDFEIPSKPAATKSNLSFSNPWSSSRGRRYSIPPLTNSPYSSNTAYESNPSPTRKSIMGRISRSSRPGTAESSSSVASSSSFFALKSGKRSRSVARTQPYGPPYHAAVPGMTDELTPKSTRLRPEHASIDEVEKDPLVHILDSRLAAHSRSIEEEAEAAEASGGDYVTRFVDERRLDLVKRLEESELDRKALELVATQQIRGPNARRPSFKKRSATRAG